MRPIVVDPPSGGFPTWALILILVVVLGGLIAVGVYFFLKKRKQRLANNLAEYNQLEGTKGGAKSNKTLE